MKQINVGRNLFALIDDEDFDLISKNKWHLKISKSTDLLYAQSHIRTNENGIIKSKNLRMHRVIMKIINPKIIIDHIDGNGLNNQKCNLRIASFSGNGANRRPAKGSISKYIGVTKCKKKWKADITKDGKSNYLGVFDTEIAAAKAYNEKAILFHGKYARLNEI